MKFILLFMLPLVASAVAMSQDRSFLTGVDANYALDLELKGHSWKRDGQPHDVYKILADHGANAFRVRLWTGEEGMNGLKYAADSAKRAKSAGLQPYLVIFLSENWADMVKQPLPKIWEGLDETKKLAAIEAYAAKVTQHFKDAGVNIDLYEIGNEIDFGICGVFEEEWPKRVSLEYMRERIWSKMAPIIAAAQRGVKSVNPNAKFILHLARWNELNYAVAFWKYMLAQNVAVDFPGLSYFPTSVNNAAQQSPEFIQEQVKKIHAAIDRPVIICELGYPSQAKFDGQFADWNKPVPNHTLDEAGQAKWVAEFFKASRSNPALVGVFYWSPEWNPSPMWGPFALFDEKGNPKPALNSLKH